MAEIPHPVEKTSLIDFWKAHPIAATFATIGLLAVLGGTTVFLHKVGLIDFDLLQQFYDSDEAPIRVRNGSIDLYLESGSQKWAEDGNSGNWKSTGGELDKDEYDVLVTVPNPASCPNGDQLSGKNVVVTYNNGVKIRIQANNKHTLVKPDGATLTVHTKDEQRLRYVVDGGYIASIGVGPGNDPPASCTFTSAAQLDNLRLRGKP